MSPFIIGKLLLHLSIYVAIFLKMYDGYQIEIFGVCGKLNTLISRKIRTYELNEKLLRKEKKSERKNIGARVAKLRFELELRPVFGFQFNVF